MGLYLKSGYLDQRFIQSQADKHDVNFIIEIGARQVGKTYGTLQLMLEQGKTFILMRRTQTEVDFICNEINNPFTVFKDYDISVKKDTKYTGAIYLHKEGSDPQYIGAIMALSTIAKIRGFNGGLYTDLVFDEFIPENHVVKIKDEGDAFLNAVTTIAGGREENGQPPLRVWMLANANTINSPILQAFGVGEKVERMANGGYTQELSILSERGIMIILPASDKIIEKRKQSALARAVNQSSKFARMAYDNDFAYNDSSDIINRVNLHEYSLKLIICDIGIYMHKSNRTIYCSPFINGRVDTGKHFYDTEKDRAYVKAHYYILKSVFLQRQMYFSDLTCKGKILDIIL